MRSYLYAIIGITGARMIGERIRWAWLILRGAKLAPAPLNATERLNQLTDKQKDTYFVGTMVALNHWKNNGNPMAVGEAPHCPLCHSLPLAERVKSSSDSAGTTPE